MEKTYCNNKIEKIVGTKFNIIVTNFQNVIFYFHIFAPNNP